jgi:predicted transcriptional regulator
MDVDNQILVKFMLEKLGGEDAVMMEFRESQIWEAAAGGKTLGELFEEAKVGGWLINLQRLRVSALVKIIERNSNRSKPRQTVTTVRAKPIRRPRLSASEKHRLRQDILAYLKENPGSLVGTIAASVDMESRKVGMYVRQLRDEGKIVSQGEKGNTTYALNK